MLVVDKLTKEEEDILLTVLGEKIESIENCLNKMMEHINEIDEETANIEEMYDKIHSIGMYDGLKVAKSILTGTQQELWRKQDDEKE